MNINYSDHKIILQQEEQKVIYFITIFFCSLVLLTIVIRLFDPKFIINVIIFIIGVYIAHRTNNLKYFKWIITTYPAFLPYQFSNILDGRLILFGMMHSLLTPIFCIFLSRSLLQSLCLVIINAGGNFLYLQSKLFGYLNIQDDELKKNSIRIAFGLSFIIVSIYILGLWYLFESRKNILESLCKGKKEINEINEKLTLANKLLNDNLKSKQDLLLHVSHEIRNSLNIISGSCELAFPEVINPKVGILLRKIASSVEIITYFLNNLLDGAKMEKHQLEIIPKLINTWEFLEKLWNTACILIERRSLKAKMFVDKKIPLQLNTDPMRITQILYNLVGNASKFTMNGYVGIVVTWTPKDIPTIQTFEEKYLYEKYFRQAMMNDIIILDDEGTMSASTQDQFNDNNKEFSRVDSKRLLNFRSYTLDQHIKTLNSKIFIERYAIMSNDSEQNKSFIHFNSNQSIRTSRQIFDQIIKLGSSSGILKIEVIDSGCGMDTYQLNKLFEEYSQVGTNNQKQMGTGLGLTISKSLCKMMGGNLEVTSKPNHGTTFIATISLDQYSSLICIALKQILCCIYNE